jgi:hypothetical protein
MLKKLPVQPQLEMFKTVLTSFINPQHELCLLAKEIDSPPLILKSLVYE